MERVKGFIELEKRFSRRTLLLIDILLVLGACILNVTLRLIPAVKEPLLQAGDPIKHFMITGYVLELGHVPEVEGISWYPWGLKLPTTLPILHYYLGAALYKLVSLFVPWLTLKAFCSYIPAFFSSIACVAAFLLGKEIGDRWTGFFAAYSLALMPAYMFRTLAGFYRHEQFAVPLIAMSVYFMVKAVKSKELRKLILNGVVSGVFALLSAGLWAGFRFLVGGYALLIFLALLLNKGSRRFFLAVSIPVLVCIALSPIYPRLRTYPLNPDALFGLAAVLMSVVAVKLREKKMAYLYSGFLPAVASLAIPISVWCLNLVPAFSGRLYTVLNPFAKMPRGTVAPTVAEHLNVFKTPEALSSVVEPLGLVSIPAVIGAFISVFERKTERSVVLILSALALYFTLTMIRNRILLAFFVALLAGLAFSKAVNYARERVKRELLIYERMAKRKRKKKVKPKVNWRRLVVPVLILLAFAGILAHTGLMGYTLAKAVGRAKGFPDVYYPDDWIDALDWIKRNTSKSDVILSWWDYGYWIQYYSGRRTLIDGMTVNSSQIRRVAKAFMSSEYECWKLCMMYNVSYVVVDVFLEVDRFIGGKWTAICFIAGRNFGDFVKIDPYTRRAYPTDKGMNITLFKMFISPEKMKFFKLVHKTPHGEVYIFKVLRPEELVTSKKQGGSS